MDVVYVYNLNVITDQWVQLGDPILPGLFGSTNNINFGYGIDMKQTTNTNLRIAIGAPLYVDSTGDGRGGAMGLFQLKDGAWNLVGLPVVGPQASSFGETIACNEDCTLLAIGAPDDCVSDDICGGAVYVVRYTYAE
jgi:hypothetical protein